MICLEGGPYDHSYHKAHEELSDAIIKVSEIDSNKTNADAIKVIDQHVLVYIFILIKIN